MDLFGVIIYFVIIIIYAIANANGYNGRYSRNNSRLRDLYDIEEFSFGYDPLGSVREDYNTRLQEYYQYNKPRFYLKNNYCELRLITNGTLTYFYCKERSDGRKKGRFFDVRGNSEHASTMWAILDMEFNKRSNYNSMRKLYYTLNQGFETTGGLRYFYEPWQKKYPNYDDNSAQNEYCRLELKKTPNNQFVIVCSEVWGKSPKQFAISGNKYLLQKIIADFAKERNKFHTYLELLAKYSLRTDCKVQVLEKTEEDVKKQTVQPVKTEEQTKEPEPTKYIHVDTDEKNAQEKQNKDEDISNIPPQEIEKYNERNLDL